MPPSIAQPEPPEDAVLGSAGDSRDQVDWAELPDPLRERIAELTASALGKIRVDDIPPQLRRIARFAPTKRARVGGPAMLIALRDSARFRAAVLEWLREHRHDALDADVDEPVAAAAAAVLLGEADASSRVRLVEKNAKETSLRAERDAALARGRKLEAELTQARAELKQALADVERARGEREAELERLRGRLREQGMALRAAKDDAEQARADAAQARAEGGADQDALTAELERMRQRVEQERTRAEKAVAGIELARQSAKEARDADEVRLALLLDTLGGAVDGLRRELSVTATGRRPGDKVRGASAGPRDGRLPDATALDRLLSLPHVHLIVDGYNVTKTGYPELTLSDQRERLAGQLAALGARTGAEVTVVFDGANVTSVPVAATRAVRVLFSDPGVLADDVIKSMVAAEPPGRPLVVVTSDKEITSTVLAAGAHVAPSAVLLTRLGRV